MNSTDRFRKERSYADRLDLGATLSLLGERDGIGDDHLIDLALYQSLNGRS